MKNSKTISGFLLGALTLAGSAWAIPCSSVLPGFTVGMVDLTHSPPSTRKPLLQVALKSTPVPEALKTLLGSSATLSKAYSVVDTHFTTDATLEDIQRLRQFSIAATVSLTSSPDTCFVVWFSPDNQLVDFNIVLTQDPAGPLSLGSGRKDDRNLYMTLTPES